MENGIKISDVNNIKETKEVVSAVGGVVLAILKSGADQATIQTALQILPQVMPQTSGHNTISGCYITGDTYNGGSVEEDKAEQAEEDE